ncbi:MAG TPA: carboxypeptidase regulatory-like domain-containing protein [Thermoanaerobaculia bacterium]|nr:carboxypeptidase regulatory-like domain-containing protein [Thermoanaerobaculia bacterium]
MSQAKYVRFLPFVSLFIALLIPIAASGQSSSGSISGTVADEGGGILPGVTVTATNIATGVERMAVSNEAGRFRIALSPGTYGLSGELSGFQAAQVKRVVVNIGTDVALNLTLRPGLTETLTVTTSAPVIETTRSEVSSVVNERSIENLPANGRNFIDFVLTTPGVVRDVRLGDISFAGQRGTLNSLVVDGANNDNTFFGQAAGRTGSGRAPYQFSQDAVKEFQVNSNAYSAEYGRAGGAVINVVTKSGTNEFHGTVFNFYRDRSLNTKDYISEINNRPKSPYHFDQYGASLGGPIVRDKHFFFANYDAQRNSLPNLVILGGGRITNFPTDADSQRGLVTLQALAGSYSQQQNQDVYLLKTDHELGGNNHLAARYNRQSFKGVNLERGGITNAAEHSGNSNVFTDSFSLVFSTVATGSFFNEVRAQYLKDQEPGEANSALPEASISQGGNHVLDIGRNFFSPRETTIKRYQLADTATYVFGNHTFKGGFDYNRDDILNFFPGNFSGSYRFDSLADFANGRASRFVQAFAGEGTSGPTTNPDLEETGLFLQDEWRVNPSLTLNLGLRYDKQDIAQSSVRNPDAQLLAAGYRTDEIPIDGNNIGPRLGFAWTPRADGRTVVRGGYGIFHGRTTSIMVGTAHSNNGINVQTITFTGSLIPAYPSIYTSIPTGAALPRPNIFVFDPDFESPEVQQSSLGIEQQIGTDFAIGLTYQYVQGDDLPRSRDVNVSNPEIITATVAGGGTRTFTRYNGRPFANFARVIAFESTASSRYNGITLDVQRRFANNWQARLAWTHATVEDDKPDATAVVPFTFDDAKYISDPLNIGAARADGDNDVRDRIVLSGVWSLDSYAQNITNNVLRALASGWTLSGIASYQSGQPFTPVVSADLNNDGNSRNDIAPGFTRNSQRLPSQVDVSPRITRDITLFYDTRLQLIAEAFNVLNRSNVNGVNTTFYGYNSSTRVLTPVAAFNTPVTSTGPRIIQLAAKLTF